VIDTIEDLSRRLSESALSPRQVADGLGTIIADHGAGSDLVVRPNDAGFSEARVMRKSTSDEPAFVELSLSDGSSLSVADLTARFGEYSIAPMSHGEVGRPIVFDLERPGLPYRCTLIAQVEPGAEGLADAHVLSVIIRRDTNSDD
jgi:hypothetical protein